MALVPPVELVPPLIVLVGGRVDAEGAVWVAFRVVFLGELVLCKGFWIVLLRVCHDGRGIQANERRIHHAQLIQLPQEAVIGPVGRQWLHNIEAAVMGDEPIVVQIIRQICDL